MEKNIKIHIKDRVAVAEGDPVIVCGNGDYTVTFSFDEEWGQAFAKTARFKFTTAKGPEHIDQPFTGDTVEVPELSNIREVEVGVFVGDLNTTTGASIRCKPCIRCGGGAPKDPTPDVYDELMELINENGGAGADGLSAYEVAVKNGFEGSEEEWLESLRGAPGETGPQGPQGEKGEPGLSEIEEGSIDSKHIKENAVEGRHLVNEAIDGHHLQNDSIGDGHIREGAVTESKIFDGAVSTKKLAVGAVSSGKIINKAIHHNHIYDSAVRTNHLLEKCVTSDKLADKAVTDDKLAEKYMKDIEVTAEDNGKFLMVVDGKVAAVSVPNITEGVF